MKKAILATKIGMTQIFDESGEMIPVTVLQAGPCCVTQIKTEENDGYSAVQVGFVDKKEKAVNVDATGRKEVRNRHGVNKPQRSDDTRFQVPSPSGFQRCMLQPEQGIQGQRHAGSHGKRESNCSESGSCSR